METTSQRASYVVLCLAPLLLIPVVAIRGLRISGVYQTAGVVLCAGIGLAAWKLGARAIVFHDRDGRTTALSGSLLVAPWLAMSLLWVGLGTPWDASPKENEMRYAVLVFGTIVVTVGFVALADALSRAGEHFYSVIAFTLNLLAGGAYLVWTSFQFGMHAIKASGEAIAPAAVSIANVLDALLFTACVLTYLSTAAFAASLAHVRWLGSWAAQVYQATSLIATALIVMRLILSRSDGCRHALVRPPGVHRWDPSSSLDHAFSAGRRFAAALAEALPSRRYEKWAVRVVSRLPGSTFEVRLYLSEALTNDPITARLAYDYIGEGIALRFRSLLVCNHDRRPIPPPRAQSSGGL